MNQDAAAVLPALTALELAYDGALPPQAWSRLRHGSVAGWREARIADAMALQRDRAWRLLASAGRWRRRGLAVQAADNLAAARQALRGVRALGQAAMSGAGEAGGEAKS